MAHGAREGPTLTVLSGVHAVEYTPVEAVLRLADSVDASDLSSTLIMLPVVNTEGFHARKPYENSLDHLNQNRVFPGDQEGSITRRVAHAVFTQFAARSTHLVDLHSAELVDAGVEISACISIAEPQGLVGEAENLGVRLVHTSQYLIDRVNEGYTIMNF